MKEKRTNNSITD